MADTISWLHLTDLHFGQQNGWLWEGMRQKFYEDLREQAALSGPWDIVFFSGDLVQRGSTQEFKDVRAELERLWKHFRTLGSEPVLLCVPGNHDLQRPGETDPFTRQSHRWHDPSEEEVKKEFWLNSKSLYRKAVERSLKNYSNWQKSLQVPQPRFIKGLLPGDFSTVLEMNSFRLGVVGVNTTFLQLGNGDYAGKLDIHVRQLQTVCREETQRWRDSVDLAVIITHQPPSWLHPDAERQLAEIYSLGRFDSHLTGHLHESNMHDSSIAGGPVRRLRQGASMFGLEKYGISKTRPLFGYMLGHWRLAGADATEILWPRKLVTARDETTRLAPDTEYHLDVNNRVTTTFRIKKATQKAASVPLHSFGGNAPRSSPSKPPEERLRVVHPERPDDEESTKIKTKDIPRARLRLEAQHRAIRTDGHKRLATILREHYVAWLVCDWGLGKEGFIASAIEVYSSSVASDVFLLQCGPAESCEEIGELSETQFGLSFLEFCAAISSLPSAVLIFDDLPTTFANGPEHPELEDILIRSVRRFCPELRMIFVARQEPRTPDMEQIIELRPLEIQETKAYVKHHKYVQAGLDEPETLERIQEWSEGLPMRIDQMMEQLQVFSLSEVLNEGSELSRERNRPLEPIPRALREAVASLADATSSQGRQSFRLLKVLTVLRDGEVFRAIRRFYPTEPFYHNNVTELTELGLLQAIPIAQTAAELTPSAGKPRRNDADTPKLLRVPPQVRYYVTELITPEEHDQILRDSTNLLFGESWRLGEIELRKELDESYAGSSLPGPGNELVLVQYLLIEALQSNDEQQIRRIVSLGLRLCEKLIALDRFRDAVIATGTMVHLLRETGLRRDFADSLRLHGSALRMMDHESASIEISKQALDHGSGFFSDTMKASVYLNIALAHEDRDDKDEALAASNKVLKFAHENSNDMIQAQSIIAKYTIEDGLLLEKRLRYLLSRARRKGHDTAANNISLELVRRGKNPAESLRELEKVFDTAKGNYTRSLAILQKASLLTQLNRPGALTERDRELLSAAYNYSYAQRIGNLLDRCHRVLWNVFSVEHVWSSMLRLFRLSSFFWTLRGNVEREAEYVRDLDAVDLEELKRVEGRTLENEILYLVSRRQDHPAESKS